MSLPIPEWTLVVPSLSLLGFVVLLGGLVWLALRSRS